jgi:hypothetical protein
MVRSLFEYKKPLQWFLFHVALGVASAASPFPLIIYFYTFLFLSGSLLFRNQKVDLPLTYIIVYLTSFELLARMARTSPFIPYELGKYLLMILLLLGIFRGRNKGIIGFIMVLLLLPALFYDFSGIVTNVEIRFNLIGGLNVGLAIGYFYRQRFTEIGIKKIIILLTLPLVSILAFAVFRTPDLDSIEFSLSANFETAGGFGSNQVAIMLGLGMMMAFYCWLNQFSLTGNRWGDIVLIILFAFQGLLTFSRGGMIGGAIGILLILFFLSRTSTNIFQYIQLKRIKKYILPMVILLILSFQVANTITGGLLFLRYQGETTGTLAGLKEKNFNTFTSNRFNIFLGDVELLEEYGVLGVGAGASRYLRTVHKGVISHVEMSRLIAEHGIFGIIYNLIILGILLNFLRLPNTYFYKGLLFAFFFVGWYTSFHSATRTYITPLLMGLSVIIIQNGKSTLLRK